MSFQSSSRTLLRSATSLSASSYVSFGAETLGSADITTQLPLLAGMSSGASSPPASQASGWSQSTLPQACPSAYAPVLLAPQPQRPAPLLRGVIGLEPQPGTVLNDDSVTAADEARGRTLRARAETLLDRLVDPAFVEDSAAGRDICAFLKIRAAYVGTPCAIAVLPRLYIGPDGFYVAGAAQTCADALWVSDKARCALTLGLIDAIRPLTGEIYAKLDEIQNHLLREGGTDRLVPLAELACVRVPRGRAWQERALDASMTLGAGLVGVALGCLLTPIVGSAVGVFVGGSFGFLAYDALSFGATALRAEMTALDDAAWGALVAAESRAMAEAFLTPTNSLRSTPSLDDAAYLSHGAFMP